jgi:NitT/TauT family transport system ATP-binding protein
VSNDARPLGVTATVHPQRPAMANPPVIAMDRVALDYRLPGGRTIRALHDVSLVVPPRSVVSVVGPSGCGKTTLLKLVSRVLRPTMGAISIDGKPLADANLAGRLSYVFQKPLLLPWRTAVQNVLLPLEILNGRAKDEAARQRAHAALELTGLGGFADTYPWQLSGGMQQRVSLARALVIEPELLLMDEPFSSLDEITREGLQGELLGIWERAKSATLSITHNVEEAVLLSDSVTVMSGRPGSIVKTIQIDLPRPRSLDVRSHPRYIELVEEVRLALRQPATSART